MTTSRHSVSRARRHHVCCDPDAAALASSRRRTGSATMGSTVEPWGRLHVHPAGGRQPGAAAGRAQRRRRRPRAGRGRRAPRLGRGARGAAAAGRRGRHRRGPRAGPARQRAPPRADAVRPLRQPDRRGRVPPVLALADGAGGRPRAGRDAVGAAGRRRSRRAPAPRGRLHGLVAHRARPRLPDLDDVRRGPGAARRRRAREGVDAAAGLHDLRPRPAAGEREARRAVRHGHDREAGRLRRPRQRHRGAAAARTAATPCTATSGSPRRR